MKCLLVLALVAAAHAAPQDVVEIKPAVAVEAQPVVEVAKPAIIPYAAPIAHQYYAPLTYTHAVAAPVVAAPVKQVTYAYQPVETKFVPKPYEVINKKVEFVPEATGCKNSLGFEVPCRTHVKREADEESMEEPVVAAAPAMMYANPIMYNYNTVPMTYTHPMVYNTPMVYKTPMVYNAPTVVNYKALPTKVQEVEVPTPVLKTVVEKVPLKPACTNAWGMAVPCIHNA